MLLGVIGRWLVPSASIAKTAVFPPRSSFVKATVLPSGAQSGWDSVPASGVSCVLENISTSKTQMFDDPSTSHCVNAKRFCVL